MEKQEIILSVSAVENFTDEKTGVLFLKDNFLQCRYMIGEKTVRFPAGSISFYEIVLPLEKFNERLDLLYTPRKTKK